MFKQILISVVLALNLLVVATQSKHQETPSVPPGQDSLHSGKYLPEHRDGRE